MCCPLRCDLNLTGVQARGGSNSTKTMPMSRAVCARVGIFFSVMPYICDQFAMARLSKATFALMLSLLPATACLIGIIVLRRVPSLSELAGVGWVIAGLALKRNADD